MFTLHVDDEIELRLLDMYHVDEVYALIDRNRAHIRRQLPWENYHQSVDDTKNFVRTMRRNYADFRTIGTFIRYQGRYVGGLGLHIHDTHAGKGEIGYWLGQEFTGQGIITRAVRAMLDYAFGTLGLHKVIIRCSTKNPKSCAVPERLGFVEEALLVHDQLLYEEYLDMRVWRILASDWHIQQAKAEFRYPIDEKLELRLFRPELIDTYFAVVDANRDYLRQWLPWLDTNNAPEDNLGFVKSGLDQYGEYNGLQCAIWYEGVYIGAIGYHYWDLQHGKTEIGYWLAEAYTGKGIMTRCVRTLVDYAFQVLGLHRIEIPCAVGNHASCGIPQRLGFTHEGVLRSAEWLYDHYVDLNMYALLAQEWQG